MGNELTNEIANKVTEEATTGFFQRIFDVYNDFISIFPEQYQWIVSVIIILAIAAFLWNLIKKNWLWIVLLIVIFQGVLPVLQNIFNSLAKMLTGN
jgi:hypothetical protein